MEIVAGVGTATVLGSGLYSLVRPLLKYRVNCHFCCQDVQVNYNQRNSFTCQHCHQYNGWDSSGDYNRPLTASQSCRYIQDQQQSQKQKDNGLCRNCNLNQELKIRQLAACNSNGQDLIDYSAHLERAYRLCDSCEEVLSNELNRQDSSLAPSVLELRLHQSKLNRSSTHGTTNKPINKMLGSLITTTQVGLMTFISMLTVEKFNVMDILATTHPSMVFLYNVNDIFCNIMSISHLILGILVLLLLFLLVSRYYLISSPRIGSSPSSRYGTTPRNKVVSTPSSLMGSTKSSSLSIPNIEERNSTPTQWEGSQASPKPTRIFSSRSPSLFSDTPNIEKSYSTPPLPFKSKDEIAINHEFALDDTDSEDCDMSVLSIGEHTSSTKPNSPFLPKLYSPETSALSLFSPPSPLLRPSRLTSTSWVAGGYWKPPSSPLHNHSRASSQSSGFVSSPPSVVNYFSSSQQGSVYNYPAHGISQQGPDLGFHFSSPAPSVVGLGLPPPRRPTLEETLSTVSDMGYKDPSGSKKSPTIDSKGTSEGWTFTITITPGGVLLGLSIAANVALAILWIGHE